MEFKMIKNEIDGKFKIVETGNEDGTAFASEDFIDVALEHFHSVFGDVEVDLSAVEKYILGEF